MSTIVQQLEEITGQKPGTVDKIFQQVKANSAKLDSCAGPHVFSVPLERRTKEPVTGTLTPAQRFGCHWRCSQCGGQVDSITKLWYEKGLKHGQGTQLNLETV